MNLFDVVFVRSGYKPYVYTKHVIRGGVELIPSSIVSPHLVIVWQGLIVFEVLDIVSLEFIATRERLTLNNWI